MAGVMTVQEVADAGGPVMRHQPAKLVSWVAWGGAAAPSLYLPERLAAAAAVAAAAVAAAASAAAGGEAGWTAEAESA